MKRFIAVLLCITTICSALCFSAAAADDFSKVLANFPDSYKASLTALHKAHPNWVFKRVSVGKNFATCLDAEHNCRRQECTVEASSATDPRVCPSSCKDAAYHLIADGTRCASYDYIAECMDPTNFLRENLIFQFEYLNAKSYYTRDKLEKALDASYSFMYKKTCKVSGKTYYYSQIILDACKQNNIDALFIIGRITNEVGALYPVKLAKGYKYKDKTVYNFFSVGAYPTANASAPENGAKYAYNHGWTNPKAALEGGIKFIAQNYTKAGQYTNYFQKYQVNPNSSYGFYEHQYMQGVEAIINESGYTFKNYNALGILDHEHIFYLPVYENLSKVNYESQDLKFRNASESETFAYVNSQVSSELSLRSGPSTGDSKICGIAKSTLLQYKGKSGSWYHVRVLNGAHKNKTGYVHSDYVNMAQKLVVAIGSSITLKPKLRTSTCSYGAAFNTDAGAVGIKNGKANGFKAGYAVFKATSSRGSVCYLEIATKKPIGAPTFTLKAFERKANISWKAVSGADFYRVYLYHPSNDTYTRLAQTKKLTFTHTGLKDGTKYFYLVRAFDNAENGSAYTAKNNKVVTTLSARPKVTLSAQTNTLTATWKGVKAAKGYGIWLYNASTDKYKKVANTTKLSYTISSLAAHTKYTILVRSYNVSGWSAFTRKNNVSITTAPAAPKVTVAGGAQAIRLRWGAEKGAAFYRVYAYNVNTGKYVRLAQTKALTYKITDLKDGTQYTFLVRAFASEYSGSSFSTKNHVEGLTVPAKPTVAAKAGNNSVTLSWSKVKGATQYGIWQYNAESGKYRKLADTTALSFEVTALQPETEYAFLVRANNATGWSLFTDAEQVKATTKA